MIRLLYFSALLIPLGLFLNRFLIPDYSFDTVNYHIFIGERAMGNFLRPFSKYEFFPTGLFNFSPVYEVINAAIRNIVGYRLGTILSLISIYVTFYFVIKILKLFISKKTNLNRLLIFAVVINGLIIQDAFMQIATYYVDSVNAALVTAALYYLLYFIKQNPRKIISLIISSSLLGLSLAGKLTNFIYILPYLLIIGYELIIIQSKTKLISKLKMLIVSLIFLFIFLLPILVFNYQQTGNPLFPFINSIFKSVYYSGEDFRFNFGAKDFINKMFYFITTFKTPVLYGETHEMFNDFKLNLFILSGFFIFFKFKKKLVRLEKYLLFFFICSYFIWSFIFGYLRYAIALEAIGSVILIILFYEFDNHRLYTRLFKVIISIFLIWQNLAIINFNLIHDISWRNNYYLNKNYYLKQIPYLFYNQTAITEKIKDSLSDIDITVNCYAPSSAYYQSINNLKDKPMILIDRGSSMNISLNNHYRRKVAELLLKNSNKEKYKYLVLIRSDNENKKYLECIDNLKSNKFSIDREEQINNYLGYEGINLVLIKGSIRIKEFLLE